MLPVVVACLVTSLVVVVAGRGLERQQQVDGPKLADVSPSVPAEDVYQHEYSFSNDWFTHNLPVWEKALGPYRGRANLNYLEIGLFEGCLLLWMFENILTHPTARATGIDPFDWADRKPFLSNLNASGFAEQVTTIIGFSQEEMRALPLRMFDIIYIDGSHAADDVLEDAILSARLLKPGGLLIIDDYLWDTDLLDRPLLGLNTFYRLYGQRFDVIHSGYQLILKARAE